MCVEKECLPNICIVVRCCVKIKWKDSIILLVRRTLYFVPVPYILTPKRLSLGLLESISLKVFQ